MLDPITFDNKQHTYTTSFISLFENVWPLSYLYYLKLYLKSTCFNFHHFLHTSQSLGPPLRLWDAYKKWCIPQVGSVSPVPGSRYCRCLIRPPDSWCLTTLNAEILLPCPTLASTPSSCLWHWPSRCLDSSGCAVHRVKSVSLSCSCTGPAGPILPCGPVKCHRVRFEFVSTRHWGGCYCPTFTRGGGGNVRE
jgi:hypothetical protein